mmetsp:Transcript_9535/g.9861  ORF Transcript_9535/g.9861 Transcript_9535/m.9861 type:complete len:187 (-) Transcript_9535:61-621(-)
MKLIAIILLFSFLFSFVHPLDHRVSYKDYVQTDGTFPGYHILEILWSNSAVSALTTETWRYQILTNSGTPTGSNNSDNLLDRYENYLIGVDGLPKNSRFYVAWTDDLACADATGATATVKVVFFNCYAAAKDLYTNVLAASLHKALVNPLSSASSDTDATKGNLQNRNFGQFLDSTGIASCPAVFT